MLIRNAELKVLFKQVLHLFKTIKSMAFRKRPGVQQQDIAKGQDRQSHQLRTGYVAPHRAIS
jgi:hypothetical protein